MFTSIVKRALYRSGALGIYHRVRNRRTLSIVMFHRVLSPADPRWASADPDYTISDDLFACSLEFFRRHYSVVSLADVLAALDGAPLPPRALLITFDDGWWDTYAYALPRLRAAGLPSVLFVASDVIDRPEAFWQERLVAAWRAGRLSADAVADLLRSLGLPVETAARAGLASVRGAIAALEALPPEARERALAPHRAALDDPLRQMVTADELRALADGGVAIGTHGRTHTHLTRAADPAAELRDSSARIAEVLGGGPSTVESMSFPHGAWNARLAAAARECGYRLLGTSVPTINDCRRPLAALQGRFGFETRTITDRAGRYRPELLALFMFRRPVGVVDAASRP